jgi:gamma-tubulin complex component 2
MQTCTLFATYIAWLSREVEKIDPDLVGTEKPTSMSKQQWSRYQSERRERSDSSQSSTTSNAAATRVSVDVARMEKINDAIKKYEHNFSRHLQILLDALNHYAATETVVLLGLCARLSTANQGTQYSGLRTDEDGGA